MICSKCKIDKDSSDFYKKNNSKTGFQINCKSCAKKIIKDFYHKNIDKEIERKKKYRSTESYKINNKKYESEYKNKRKIKRKENIKIRLGSVLRDMIQRCLKGEKKETRTFKLLGYDTVKLKQRIECQFSEGMSWSNYGQWHIDHKKPISKFKDGSNISVINALSNLQPLWAKDNLSKGNKF
jgi:hypothetical protein